MDKKNNSIIIVLSIAVLLAQGMDTLHYLLLEHSYPNSTDQQNVGTSQDNFFHHCDPKIFKTFYTAKFDVYPSTHCILNVRNKFDFSYINPLKQANKNKLAQRGPPDAVS